MLFAPHCPIWFGINSDRSRDSSRMRSTRQPPNRLPEWPKHSSRQQLESKSNRRFCVSCQIWPKNRSKRKSHDSHKPRKIFASIPIYPFLLFLPLLRLAATNAFTRATFFRCFFLVLRSFSRPVPIVSPNCKKWRLNEPLVLALCESV